MDHLHHSQQGLKFQVAKTILHLIFFCYGIFQIPVPDSPPSNISVEVSSSTEVILSWQPPQFWDQNGPITYYSLIVKELTYGLGETHINLTTPSYTLTGLEKYNNYSFVIAAATEKGLGPYIMAYNFTTKEDCKFVNLEYYMFDSFLTLQILALRHLIYQHTLGFLHCWNCPGLHLQLWIEMDSLYLMWSNSVHLRLIQCGHCLQLTRT